MSNTSPEPTAAPPVHDAETVLVVDDTPANLEILTGTLKGHGYRLLVAKSGAQALTVVARTVPDLVLLDIMMPDMDGFEVCRRLKANPRTRDCAVIFISALGQTEDKVEGFRLGALDYVTKPFQGEEVIARVATHLKLRRLEKRLAARNLELETTNQRILAAMADGLYGLDAQGRVEFANPSAARLTGRTTEEVLGRDLRRIDLIARPDGTPYEDHAHPLSRALDEGRDVEMESDCLRHKNGRCLPAELSCTPIRADGKTLGAVVAFRDIRRRREAEQGLHEAHAALEQSHKALQEAQAKLIQAARLESVGRLAAGVAHEVKNPLAVIQLGVDYLHHVFPGATEDREVLDDIEDAVRRADTVIKGLLDFSRSKPDVLQPGDLDETLGASLRLVDHELARHNIRLDRRPSPDAPRVALDRDKIQQVFINLFMNAVHAMGRNGRLTVITERRRLERIEGQWHGAPASFQPGETVILVRIEDTGCGIAESKVDKVFDPFFTTKPVGQGTGLGLSVTHNIVNLHRAAIRIENRPEGGVAVSLLFHAIEGD